MATGDDEFMSREGIDILVQTARLWADLGFWRGPGPGAFHIHGVTGPATTPTGAAPPERTVAGCTEPSRSCRGCRSPRSCTRPDRYARMVARLHLADEEVVEWERVADAMAIPYDESLGINPQDSHFHEREVWDLPNTPADKRPLMLHYHPLVIYRFQVLKQADVVLATFLQGEQFTPEQKRADFEYYDPITTGASTLSAVVQSIMAAEVGYHEMALRYFHSALFVDLADLHQNTVDGVHIASAAGVWGTLVNGFGGMRAHDG